MIRFILGFAVATALYANAWYGVDNQETRAYVEYLSQRDYYPPDIETPLPKQGLPKLPEGYNARKDGPVWLTVEDLG